MTKPDLTALQERSIQLRAADTDKREITGIAIPYSEEITYWGYRESFAPGSIDAAGAILRYGHQEPIGKIIATRDLDEGFEITARISHTERGDEIWTLIKDGVLTSMSIGFEGKRWEESEDDDGNARIKWLEVNVREVSVVEFPAYSQAKITNHRSKETMTDTKIKAEDLNALTERFDTLERSIAVMNEKHTEAPAPAYRSFGEYVKDYIAGEDNAKAFQRAAYDSSNLVDRAPWLGVLEKRMQAKQPLAQTFRRIPLPSTGMTMEYAKKKTESTITVAKQASEGGQLVTGSPASWDVESAKVETYGGVVAEVTRQAIERTTSPAILDEIFTDLAFQYATAIEKAVHAQFKGVLAESKPATTIANLDALDQDALLDILIDLSDAFEDTAYPLDGLLVSPSVFKKLAKLPYDRRALQIAGAPSDHMGTLTVVQPGAASVGTEWTIRRVRSLTGDVFAGYSKEAITLAEQPGAPLRLEDENIQKLTKDYAVYGYAATYSAHPELIKPVKIGA